MGILQKIQIHNENVSIWYFVNVWFSDNIQLQHLWNNESYSLFVFLTTNLFNDSFHQHFVWTDIYLHWIVWRCIAACNRLSSWQFFFYHSVQWVPNWQEYFLKSSNDYEINLVLTEMFALIFNNKITPQALTLWNFVKSQINLKSL